MKFTLSPGKIATFIRPRGITTLLQNYTFSKILLFLKISIEKHFLNHTAHFSYIELAIVVYYSFGDDKGEYRGRPSQRHLLIGNY